MVEPGRSIVAPAGLTLYTVGTIKRIEGVRTYVAVDGGMSDNLRPMLYGSRYEALIADRPTAAPDTVVTVAGMHCESGDVIVRDANLATPAVGDVLVTPTATRWPTTTTASRGRAPRSGTSQTSRAIRSS